MISYEQTGSGPPLVMLHGFTQSARTWGKAADALAASHRLLLVDAPGHGRSAGVTADLTTGADLMARAVGPVAGPAAWLGYSMGGRFALHVALGHPDLVDRLILVSTTAGIADADERAARRQWDEDLARRVESEGVGPFVTWWLHQPLFATLPEESAQMEGRMGGDAAGLAASLRLAGTGAQEPLWARLDELAMPVLVVAGRLDTRYVDLAERLVEAIGPNASIRVIEEAGHACHLEQPERFTDLVAGWLAEP